MGHHVRGLRTVASLEFLKPTFLSPDLLGNLIPIALLQVTEGNIGFLTDATDPLVLASRLNDRRVHPIALARHVLLVQSLKNSRVSAQVMGQKLYGPNNVQGKHYIYDMTPKIIGFQSIGSIEAKFC